MIPRFITQALQDEPLTVHGDGHATRDWLYVDDDAEAIEAVIEAPLERVAGEVLNLATGIDISVEEIADKVLDALGKPRSLEGARHRAAGPGRSPHRLDGEGAGSDRLARAHALRRRARADRRVVSRE